MLIWWNNGFICFNPSSGHHCAMPTFSHKGRRKKIAIAQHFIELFKMRQWKMQDRSIILETQRLRLRCWEKTDQNAFAALNSNTEVMNDLGGSINRTESNQKLDRYIAAFDKYGFSRWAVETRKGDFLGYAGIMPRREKHPLGSHNEIGWRLIREAWGHGYATEAAKAALDDVFIRVGLTEVIAYTSPDNVRSQAVMGRLGLQRDSAQDFDIRENKVGNWRGLVWVARSSIAI